MSRSSRTPSPVLPVSRFNGSFQDSAKKTPNATVEPILETTADNTFKQWKPLTLRRPFLFAVIAITLGLLALVQVLVIYDQHQDGILFAPKISELGAGYLFLYRYLPTIIAVTYAFVWHWIDVDTTVHNNSLVLTYNYAYGGATINATLVQPYEPTVLSLIDQVNQFLAGAAKKPATAPWTSTNSLFSVWIGINDIGNSYYLGGDRDA